MKPHEAKGLWLGALGVTIFALTLPMTRLAVDTPAAPQMSGAFIALGRAVVAALLSALFLVATRAPLPRRADWLPLAITSAGVVFGFPLLTSIAMRHVEAVHASVIVGVLPLATAAVGAWLHRQRPSAGFWLCAAAGSALVVAFAVLRSGQSGLSIQPADALLLGAMACAAIGYGWGARLSQHMRAEHVICWALVLSLPATLAVTLVAAVAHPPHASAAAWSAFGYVTVISMFLGFFAWYAGLARGGIAQVGQIQLAQPLLTLIWSALLLGEAVTPAAIIVALVVLACVVLLQRIRRS